MAKHTSKVFAGPGAARRAQRGSSMLEILVSIFVMTLGLLGMAALQVRAQQAELESYQLAQGMILVNDMVDRINANRKAAGCYNFTVAATGLAGAGAMISISPSIWVSGRSSNTRRPLSGPTVAWRVSVRKPM